MPARLKRRDLKKNVHPSKEKFLWPCGVKIRAPGIYLQSHAKKIKESSLPVQKNSDEVSGTIAAAKLAKLPKMFKIRAKQGIKKTIFKKANGESESFSC